MVPPRLFLLGALVAPMVAFSVYWGFRGTRWYEVLSAVYQFAGIFLALWQALQLRTQLGQEPVRTLLLRGLRRRPAPVTVNAAVSGVVVYSAVGGVDVTVIDDNASVEDQLKELRGELGRLKHQLASAETELKAHKNATTSALSELRSSSGQHAQQLQKEIAQAVTSSPLIAIFGVWLVIVGTWMQLMMAVWH